MAVVSKRLRQIALGGLILAYALIVHYSNMGALPTWLGAILAFGPLLAIPVMWAWHVRHRWGAVLSLPVASVAILVLSWPRLKRHFDWIYLWQQCAVYAAFALAFGRSLLPGQIPLCTRWATILHGGLPREALRYTRAVTGMWTLFFIAVVGASLVLYQCASRAAWSLFSNFVILPLAILLFAAEYCLRRLALPNMRRETLREMAQLYALESRTLTSMHDAQTVTNLDAPRP